MNLDKLSISLMERSGVPESVIGDMVERHRRNASATWYWRQVFIAVVLAAWRDLGADRLVAFGAVSAGWAAVVAVFGLSILLDTEPIGFWPVWLHIGPSATLMWARWWVAFLDLRFVTVFCLGLAFSGWLVARLKRGAALVFSATVAMWGLWSSAGIVLRPMWYGLQWHTPYRSVWPFALYSLGYALLTTIVMPIVTLIGGIAGADRSHDSFAE
jgi:hypothetical protein